MRTLLLFLLAVGSRATWAELPLPTVRVITFHSKSGFEAAQAVYRPVEGGLYQIETLGALFKQPKDLCETFLNDHQRRALDVMLKNRYITREFYNEVMDSESRVHGLDQYVLVTSYVEMEVSEAKRLKIPPERFLDEIPENGGFSMVRVHMGSIFAVLGYRMARSGVDSFRIEPLSVPWEVGKLPASLSRSLDSTHLIAKAEFGRALVEEGAHRDEFERLSYFLVSALSADAKALKIDPAEYAVFAHGLDSQHLSLFSRQFPARVLTPEIQEDLERNPRELLARYLTIPKMTMSELQKVNDGVVFGSLAEMKRRFPPGSRSHSAHRVQKIFENEISLEDGLDLLREAAASMREDFDFEFHDEHRPGHRQPIVVRYFGISLSLVKLFRAVRAKISYFSIQEVRKILFLLKELKGVEPEFGTSSYFEQNLFSSNLSPSFSPNDPLPVILVSNFDPAIAAENAQEYLGQILFGVVSKIKKELEHLSWEETLLIYFEMLETRIRRGLGKVEMDQINLRTFLESNDLIFGTSDDRLKTEIMMLGGSPAEGIQFSGGKSVSVKVEDLLKEAMLSLDEISRDPKGAEQKLNQAMEKKLIELVMLGVQATTVYRFQEDDWQETERELKENAPGGLVYDKLSPSFHSQKVLRVYNSLH